MNEIEFIESVKNGAKWRINLKQKLCKVDGKEIEIEPCLLPREILIDRLNKFYLDYKYSYPSERSDRYSEYFEALTESEMTDEELIVGMDREVARAKLELLCLMSDLSVLFTAEKQWFWKGTDGLIILKEWI